MRLKGKAVRDDYKCLLSWALLAIEISPTPAASRQPHWQKADTSAR